MNPAKTDELIQMLLGGGILMWAQGTITRWQPGVDPSMGKGALEGLVSCS